jgi:serine/threonine protein kinase
MPSSEPGSELGHYRIVRLLGRGGMGNVYLARDLTLERDVAIKILPAGRGDPDDTRKRLLREAQAAAALDHPNICAIYEVGEAPDGSAFIVMQYVEGETLATTLQRGPMTVRDALVLAAQITEALSAAHKRGIVHRDLKPQNVIVTPSGRPKLLDFGLAKVVPAQTFPSDASTRSIETVAGIIKGTPAYMSPEQIQQRSIDGRTDLFALGAVLFECLTGQRAFGGANALEIFGQILHVHPPPTSRLRSGLTERHDELCRRLLAKDPADRFQSADEVTGALRLLTSDSARDAASAIEPQPPHGSDAGSRPPGSTPGGATARDTASTSRRWSRPALVAAVLVLVASAVVGLWIWNTSRALPPVPGDAERWYQRGAEAIREGAYHSGQLALQEAVRLFPQYPIAHARLAEALAELDDERGAQAQLLRLSSVLPDESRLPDDERLRLQGTRALVLRDLEVSVAAYRRLAERHASDATAWLDLGRAQEAASRGPEARVSYARAVGIDPQYAAARLRLGAAEAQESRREEALAAFAESERLYRVAANTEGEAEVLLRRGAFHDAMGDLKRARADLERAVGLATTLKGTHQLVRAQMALSSVTASEGRFAESERIASEAVQQALDAGLDTVAATGLVDLAATLAQSARLSEASTQAERALQLAERRGARRTSARARIQLAAIRLQQDRPKDSLALAERAVAFLKPNKYRRYELLGLSVMSRAYEQLDDLDRARAISTDVVATAEALGDDVQVGMALSNLASVAAALGQLPQALAYRERAEEIRRRQNDASALPYDLANRAELLICLGRLDDASHVLEELDAGIKAGIDAYVGRSRRAAFLRALTAVTALRPQDAVRILRTVQPSDGGDSVSVLAPVLLHYSQARLGPRSGTSRGSTIPGREVVDPALARERQYWRAAVLLERGNATGALAEADRGLQLVGQMSNDELRWRLAALGALALRAMGDSGRERDMLSRAEQALARLRSNWPTGIEAYEKRPDLAELKARLGPA